MPKQTPPRTPRKSGPYQTPRLKPFMSNAGKHQLIDTSRAHSSWGTSTTSPGCSMPPPSLPPPFRQPAPPSSPSAMTQSSSAAWTHAEDDQLIFAKNQGKGWNSIQREYFPTKSPNACRKRYERLVSKRRHSYEQDEERVNRVLEQYMNSRESIWRRLAEQTGEHWEDVERICMERRPGILLPSAQSTSQQKHQQEQRQPPAIGSPGSSERRLGIGNLIQ